MRDAIHFEECREAMRGEFGNHKSYGTFQVAAYPRNTRLIPLLWVLTTKTNSDGLINKYKARPVEAGNQQPLIQMRSTQPSPLTSPL